MAAAALRTLLDSLDEERCRASSASAAAAEARRNARARSGATKKAFRDGLEEMRSTYSHEMGSGNVAAWLHSLAGTGADDEEVVPVAPVVGKKRFRKGLSQLADNAQSREARRTRINAWLTSHGHEAEA